MSISFSSTETPLLVVKAPFFKLNQLGLMFLLLFSVPFLMTTTTVGDLKGSLNIFKHKFMTDKKKYPRVNMVN